MFVCPFLSLFVNYFDHLGSLSMFFLHIINAIYSSYQKSASSIDLKPLIVSLFPAVR